MQPKATRISIIIPAYNEERYLAACLDSIAAQTVMPDEVIVVDNNSTDSTADIARRYPFVRLLREPHQGLVYARAAGLDQAKGDLLVRIDADTRLPADWLATLLVEAKRYPQLAGYSGRGIFYDVPFPRLFGWLQVMTFQYLQFPAMRGFSLWGANMVLKRSAWHVIRQSWHQRNDIDEDVDLSLLLYGHGLRVHFSADLQAQMSLRHGEMSPFKVARYVSTWPRDYWINGRHLAALYIGLLTILVIIFSALAWVVTLQWVKGLRSFRQM
jgi:glycosyltransferase involved in cell wall biosynthesis